jgi:hypothetical protein
VYGGDANPGSSTSIEKSKPIAANSLRDALEIWFNETGQGPALDGKGYIGVDPEAPVPHDFDEYVHNNGPIYFEGEHKGVPAAFLLDTENSHYPFYVVFQNPPQDLINSMDTHEMGKVYDSLWRAPGPY